MTGQCVKTVLVCGSGLALEMTVAALAFRLPNETNITALEITSHQNNDSFYGNITAPTAYNFFDSLGLNEPVLFRKTQTHFAFGTAFENWGGQFNWVQCYEQPFPVWDNVLFHQYVARMEAPLTPYLIGSAAGLNGRFAHPPEEKDNPLSRAEYGYVFDPSELAYIMKAQTKHLIRRVSGTTKHVKAKNGKIQNITLNSGETLEAQLFIDCDNPRSYLADAIKANFKRRYSLEASFRQIERSQGFSLKHIKANPIGWESLVRLQNKRSHLLVSLPGMQPNPDYKIDVGRRQTPWSGNVIAIGHAAGVLEPLTPAPMMMLQRDIERLLELFPITNNMDIEEKEFNRLFQDDFEHCNLFTRSLFEIDQPPQSPYWEEARSTACPDKLTRKLIQFKNRGHNTMYDLEPFNAEDWIIQHFGLGRKPARSDIFLDQVARSTIKNRLMIVKANIETMVQKMPPSDRYLMNFRRYLEKKHGL